MVTSSSPDAALTLADFSLFPVPFAGDLAPSRCDCGAAEPLRGDDFLVFAAAAGRELRAGFVLRADLLFFEVATGRSPCTKGEGWMTSERSEPASLRGS